MVEVIPFSGLLYNQEKAGPLARLIAPPYDVIRPDMQDTLYERNPYNVVRLILGRQFDQDHEKDNRYTRSARDFQAWRDQEILVPDSNPAFYIYSQAYEYEGQAVERIGFFARVGLQEFSKGNICPHEFTLAKAKQDRAKLIRACRANFSPVFGLFSDPSRQVDEKLLAATRETSIGDVEEDGVRHRMWRLTDPEVLNFISSQFADKKVYIADGHHRYETALGYFQEHGQEVPDAAWVLMFLTNLEAEGLAIYPIHRQVRVPEKFDRDEFVSRLEPFFEITPQPSGAPPEDLIATLNEAGAKATAFTVYFGGGDAVLLKLKDPQLARPFMAEGDPDDLLALDVYQLHTLILRHLLGIDTKTPEGQQFMHYNVRPAEAAQQVDAGEYQMVFYMNATRMDQVRALAEKGIRLPQKATYFYPKLLSGLVINPFCS